MASNITFRVDETLKSEFIDTAKANGTTATALFHKWMREYLYGTDNSTNNTDNCSTNQIDNSTNTTGTNITNNSTNDTTNWEGMIDDLISEKLEARLESIQNNQDYLIEKKLEDACQGAIAKMEEKMEGISCNLPQPKEDDTWEPLMTLDELNAKYCRTDTNNGTNTALTDNESTIEKLAKDEELQRFFATNAKQSAIANRIAELLIAEGIKEEGYQIKADQFSKIKKAQSPPSKGNHIKAWELYHEALGIARDRAEIIG